MNFYCKLKKKKKKNNKMKIHSMSNFFYFFNSTKIKYKLINLRMPENEYKLISILFCVYVYEMLIHS